MVEQIKALCAQKNITIQKLEKALGFGNGTIRRWDTTRPALEKVSAVASFFDVPLEYIQAGGEKPPAFFKNLQIFGEEKQPAGSGELSEDEIKLLAAYRKILDQKKPGYLDMLERAAEHKE